MHISNIILSLAALSISSISATRTLGAPFGLADPVNPLVARSTGSPSANGSDFHCDSKKLNKICGPNFLATFESRQPNITAPCKSEISQAQTYVCNYWKSGNVSESCLAVQSAWTRVKADKCLPEGGHHHKKCDKKKLDHICQQDFINKFESNGDIKDTCKANIQGAWNNVCNNEWKAHSNVTAACLLIRSDFMDLKSQGCITPGLMHHDKGQDQAGGQDGSSDGSSTS